MTRRLILTFATALCLSASEAQTARIGAKCPTAAARELVKKAPARINVPKGDDPIYDPAGTAKHYIMAYTDNNGMTETAYANGKVEARVSEDGKTIYLNGLTPGFNRAAKGDAETWLAGTLENDTLTVKAGQVLYKAGERVLYFEAVQTDAQGYASTFKDAMRFAVSADGKITQADPDDIAAVFIDGETEAEAGFYGFFYGYALEDMGEITAYAFPEGAVPAEYILRGVKKSGGTADFRKASVCFDADGSCYAAGLCLSSPDEVVRGTVSGTTVTFPKFYIIQGADLFYYRLVGGGTPGDDGDLPLQDITFTLDSGTKALTMPSSDYLLETDYAIENVNAYLTEVSLTPYAGDSPATPAAPEVVYYDSDNVALYVSVPATDAGGNYINADKLSYRFYADGEPYTFTTDNYTHLTEDMTDIPFGFTDSYDIFSNTGYKVVFFHNLTAKVLGVESVYTVDGTTSVSARAVCDITAGIAPATTSARPVSVTYTDLAGRRTAAPVKHGVTIVTTTYSDGTVRMEKRI